MANKSIVVKALGQVTGRGTFDLKNDIYNMDIKQTHSLLEGMWDRQTIELGGYIIVSFNIETAHRKRITIDKITPLDETKKYMLVVSTDYSDTTLDTVVKKISKQYGEFKIPVETNIVKDTMKDKNNNSVILIDDESYQDCLFFKNKILASCKKESKIYNYFNYFTFIEEADSPKRNKSVNIYNVVSDVDYDEKITNWISGYYIPDNVATFFPTIKDIAKHEGYFNVFVEGESGCGKTEFAKVLAEQLGYEYCEINSQMVTDPSDWFGTLEARDGNTLAEFNEFAGALQRGKTVILVDEYNRISSKLSSPLLPVLDDRRTFEFHNKTFKIAPEIVFVFSANIGYKYSGTYTIDNAFAGRRELTIRFGDLPDDIMPQVAQKRFNIDFIDALSLFNIFSKLRKIVRQTGSSVDLDMSVRTFLAMVRIAHYDKSKNSIINAINGAILNQIDPRGIPDDLQIYISSLAPKFDSKFGFK